MTEPDPPAPSIEIEVVYAEPERQRSVVLKLAPQSTVEDALRAVQIELEGVDVLALPVGVFGELCDHDRCLRSGDRVELYRPLERDPKRARRERAVQARKEQADR